jgi:TatD DNase family protein
MRLVDTHCHLDFKDFDADRDGVLARAAAAGVERIIDVGSSLEGSRRAVELAKKHAEVYAAVGIHPHEASSVTDEAIAGLRALAREKKVVAVGEVGLDFYRNLSPREDQAPAFRKFIALALETGLPLIFHSRDADEELIGIIKEFSAAPPGAGRGGLRGVVHCFSGDEAFLARCLDLGLYVSFTCKLTLKNADALRKVAACVPVERLLLETDAPFLLPAALKNRKIPNEPANLAYLADEWAKILRLSKEDVGRITTHNANRLFGLGLGEPSKIAYGIRNSLYLNITNRCTNACDFCIRNRAGEFVKGHNLWLDDEPSVGQILSAVGDPSGYDEIVFCGYGEPTLRLDAVIAVAAELKKKLAKIRVVTNGHGDLINGPGTARKMAGLVDRVSVSLNAHTAGLYEKSCKPKFGAASYAAVTGFIRDCVAAGIETEATCLDLPGVDIAKCREIAASLGARFRQRRLGAVG